MADDADRFIDEPDEWAAMTPQERWAESAMLWDFYLSMGGPVRRPGLHPVRRD